MLSKLNQQHFISNLNNRQHHFLNHQQSSVACRGASLLQLAPYGALHCSTVVMQSVTGAHELVEVATYAIFFFDGVGVVVIGVFAGYVAEAEMDAIVGKAAEASTTVQVSDTTMFN